MNYISYLIKSLYDLLTIKSINISLNYYLKGTRKSSNCVLLMPKYAPIFAANIIKKLNTVIERRMRPQTKGVKIRIIFVAAGSLLGSLVLK